jgi:hypothetical protein
MTTVIINPGSGPIQDRTLASHARANMSAFRRDVGGERLSFGRVGPISKDGRYDFELRRPMPHDKWPTTLISMPGLPLDQVRYTDLPTQDIWNYPRLYVDGSSWVWFFAVQSACEALGLPERPVSEWR